MPSNSIISTPKRHPYAKMQMHLCSSLPSLILLLLLLKKLRLLCPILFILNVPPIFRNRLISTRLFDTACKGWLTRVQLVPFASLRAFHGLVGNGHVSPESLTHVDHSALAVAETLLELLAFRGECAGERFAEAVGCFVALDHDTF